MKVSKCVPHVVWCDRHMIIRLQSGSCPGHGRMTVSTCILEGQQVCREWSGSVYKKVSKCGPHAVGVLVTDAKNSECFRHVGGRPASVSNKWSGVLDTDLLTVSKCVVPPALQSGSTRGCNLSHLFRGAGRKRPAARRNWLKLLSMWSTLEGWWYTLLACARHEHEDEESRG